MKKSILLSIFILAGGAALAATPQVIDYQGYLMESDVAVTGTKSVTFSLYDAATGGAQLCTSGPQSIAVTMGVFTYQIGQNGCNLENINFDNDVYLELEVGGTALKPRELIAGNTRYLNKSGGTMTGALTLDANLIVDTNTLFVNSTSNKVGIGTVTPTDALHVIGSRIKVENTAGDAALMFKTTVGNYSWYTSGTTDSLRLMDHTDNSIRMTIDGDGKVGIGTMTPGSKLEVNGDLRLTADSGGQLYFPDGTSMNSANIGSANSVSSTTDAVITGDSDSNSSGAVLMKTGANTRLTITNGGNVGIGTITPANRLDVEGSAAIGATYSGTSAAPSNGLIVQGNVGIAKTNPATALDVNGTVTATEFVGGGAGITGVEATDIADNAVTTAKILDGEVGSGDLADGAALEEILDDDGSGSLLDADLLDGINSTDFVQNGCTDCLNATEIEDIYVLNAGDTVAGDMAVTGKLGVGGAVSTANLNVVGTIRAQNPGSAPNGSLVELSSPGSDVGIIMIQGDGAGGQLQRWDLKVDGQDLKLGDTTAGFTRMTVDTSGQVGIGTEAPSGRLHAYENTTGAPAGFFEIGNGTSAESAVKIATTGLGDLIWGNHLGGGGNLITLQSSGADKFVVDKNGNLTLAGSVSMGSDAWVDTIGDTMTGALTMSGAGGDITFDNAGGIITLAGGNISDSTGSVNVNDDLGVTGALTAATVNTGQGAAEIYLMDQNVRTTDVVTFATVTANGFIGDGSQLTNISAASITHNSLSGLTTGDPHTQYYLATGDSMAGTLDMGNNAITNINWLASDDGGGSGLDADQLDGQHGAYYMAASTDNWVDTIGDTMTGSLAVSVNNGSNAVGGTQSGAGNGVYGYTTGTGRAGYFVTNNGTTGANTIQAESNSANNSAVATFQSGAGGELYFGNHTGASGNLMQLQSAGADKFVVDKNGNLTMAGSVSMGSDAWVDTTGDTMTGALAMSGANGDITFDNAGGNITLAGGGIGYGIGTGSEHAFYPYKASGYQAMAGWGASAPFDDGLSIMSDGVIYLAEKDTNAIIGWFNVNTGDFAWNGKVGIGTSTPGAVGAAKLELKGTVNSASDGPHIQIVTNADNYPVFQQLNYGHDNIAFNFDSYYDGTSWKSSDAGSNFVLYKNGDKMKLAYDSGLAVGNSVTWNNGIVLLASNGNVGIGTDTPSEKLAVSGNVLVSGTVTAGCPTNTVLAGDFCIDNASHAPQDWVTALNTCRLAEMHLCSVAELSSGCRAGSIGFTMAVFYLTSDADNTASALRFRSLTPDCSGAISTGTVSMTGSPMDYYCCRSR